MKKDRTTLIIALAIAIAPIFAMTAHATPFSAGSNTVHALGDEFGAQYDIFAIAGEQGNLDATSHQVVADFTFAAGQNCNVCSSTPSGQLGFSLQVGSVTQVAQVGWAWMATETADVLTVTAPADLTYYQLDGEIDVVSFFATQTILASDGTSPAASTLTASVQVTEPAPLSIPEPASLTLLAAALVGLTSMIRRKRT